MRPPPALSGVGADARNGGVTPQTRDLAIAWLAGRQHGNVTWTQLNGLGLTGRAISHRVELGRLYRVHRSVYAVGRPPSTGLERAAAAVLACGPTAVLSHHSALVLWGIWTRWQFPLHVTIRSGDWRPPGITVHRCRTMKPGDVRIQLGIKATSPARALLDCAPTITIRTLANAVDEARHRGLVSLRQLAEIIARNPTHAGAKLLAPFTNTKGGPSRSDWERDFPRFCAEHGLPVPTMNTIVCGFEVDALFEEQKVIVELDSWEFHNDRRAFEADRDRDAETLAAGYWTVRVTWERMKTTATAEATRLNLILARR
jgi:hypothetical protein